MWPVNAAPAVEALLLALGVEGGAPLPPLALPASGHAPAPRTWRDALSHHVDIGRPGLELLRWLQQRNRSAELAHLLDPTRKEALAVWLRGRNIADVLALYPATGAAAEALGHFKRLQPRLYSISSSPLVHAGQVHLTMSTVRYTAEGQSRAGVCSGWLADSEPGQLLHVFVQRSAHFRVPADPSRPIIMIGPGTGIAPFRAFLQERAASGATGGNWLFFGEQHAAEDYYYRDELEAWQNQGVLHHLHTAFSRDQAHKIYVQDRIREHGAAVCDWLNQGAHVYVCGDASRMARDVDQALRDVLVQHGKLSDEAAQAHLSQLAREKRYVRDVY